METRSKLRSPKSKEELVELLSTLSKNKSSPTKAVTILRLLVNQKIGHQFIDKIRLAKEVKSISERQNLFKGDTELLNEVKLLKKKLLELC